MTEINGLINAMLTAGLHAPEPYQLEQAINKEKPLRWSTNGKKSDRAGFCFVRQTGQILFASFGCHRSSIKEKWSSKTRNDMPEVDWQAHLKHREELVKRFQEDAEFKASEAAVRAQTRWENAKSAEASNPYLLAKNIQPYGLRAEGENLVIPCYRLDDETGSHTISTLQTVSPSGEKLFMSGGTKKGSFYEITSQSAPKDKLILCEGFATSASIFAATEISTVTCFDTGNLMHVAKTIRAKFPGLKIIFAADDDHLTIGNPGLTKATEAARAVGGYLAVPEFSGHERSNKHTDFNDLHQLAGLAAVKACIDRAALAAPADPTATSLADAWPEPTPLPNALPDVMKFDMELLPEALRGWVADIAERMQCPPDFTAVGALIALSSLIGARAVVAPKARDDWRVVPNLWGVIVGRPGVMKSPALSEVLKPLHRLESAEREKWQTALDAWKLQTKVFELAGKQNELQAAKCAAKDPAKSLALLQLAEAPIEPTMRRYLVNDATVEKLGELLTVNPWGVLVYRDELHGLLCSMDRQGQEGARGFYLTGYDGNQGHAVDRIVRGESYIPRVCLAMLGGIQPGKLQSYVRDAVGGGAGDDGLLQRFGLAVWPDVNREFNYVDRWPDTSAKQAAWAVFERLNQLQPATDTDPQEWRFDFEAQALFEEWLIPFETEIRGEELHPALVSHLSKYRKLIPALALIFALVDTPDSGSVIHQSELLRALAMGDYLRSHAERIYAAAVIPETDAAKQLTDKIKAGKLCDGDGVLLNGFTARQVAVKHWAGLGTPDAVRKAADLLTDYGWLAREVTLTGSKGGRPSEKYLIHPMLIGGRA